MHQLPSMTAEHYQLMRRYAGDREPDLVIAPTGVQDPYLYRWHVVERNPQANTYFHIQVDSDPERPLHDHPWDNMSVILAGGYEEILDVNPDNPSTCAEVYHRHPGDVIFRKADWAHRLILPKEIPYTMTLFSTGPNVRDWGFWFPQGWLPHAQVLDMEAGNVSVFKKPGAK